jgi:magnesium transporter
VARDDAAWRARTARRVLPLTSTDRSQRPGVPGTGTPAAPADSPREIDDVIGDCAVYEDGHRRPGTVPLEQASDVARSTPGFVWIGLQQPKAEDIAVVTEEFGLSPMAVDDAVKAHQRPKLEV